MVADFETLIDEGKVWVAEEGAIVGYVVMYPLGDSLHVENIAVDPLLHGHGFGARLLAFAETHAAHFGHAKVDLYTNTKMTENLSFYPAHGYRETSRGVDDGFSRVYFSKFVPEL